MPLPVLQSLMKPDEQGSKLTTSWSHMRLDVRLCTKKFMCGHTATPLKPKCSATFHLTILTQQSDFTS